MVNAGKHVPNESFSRAVKKFLDNLHSIPKKIEDEINDIMQELMDDLTKIIDEDEKSNETQN